MKKVLFCCLLLVSFVCVGCKGNVQNDIDNIENIENESEVFVDYNNADDLFDKGKANLEKGNIKEAIEQLTKAVEIKDNADWIVGDLGRAKAANNDFDGAIKCYTKAIEINDKRSPYFYWRSEAYTALGKKELAQKDKVTADDLHNKGLD